MRKHLDALEVTEEDVERIKNMDQRTEGWHAARKNRITASNFGNAAGYSPYIDEEDFLRDMLWNTFQGNAACRYGTFYEDFAEAAYKALMASRGTPVQVDHTGLIVIKACPYVGVSPDGLVTKHDGSKALLEIKCPYGRGPPSGGRVYEGVPPQLPGSDTGH